MGGKTQLYRRSSIIFFFIGVVALGLQVAGALLPFWYQDDWQTSWQLSDGSEAKAFRVFQGLWSDYNCMTAVVEKVNGSDLHVKVTGYSDCRIQLHEGPLKGTEVAIPKFVTLRALEVTSLALGFLSSLGALGLFVSARRKSCLHVTSRIFLTLCSLAAGLCSVMVVLIVAGEVNPNHLSWALSLPTLASLLWFCNGSFSFVVCRYRPGYDGSGFSDNNDTVRDPAAPETGNAPVATVAEGVDSQLGHEQTSAM